MGCFLSWQWEPEIRVLEGFGAEERGEHGAHQPAAAGGEDPRAVSAGVALPAGGWVLGAGAGRTHKGARAADWGGSDAAAIIPISQLSYGVSKVPE